MLESIKSCKLYRASKHQDKILPVLAAVLGDELVQQLSEYIDDPNVITKDEYEAQMSENATSEDASPEGAEESEDPSEESSGEAPSSGAPLSFTPSGSSVSDSEVDFDSDDFGESGSDESGETGSNDESGESNVEESTHVPSSSRIMSSVCSTNFTISKHKLKAMVDEILGTLNLRQETSGVSRVLVKGDNELWVHYNDSINLNNVLDAVLQLLNSTGYSYLEFNRLARSDNAIVFEINIADTHSGIEAIVDVNKS